MSSYFKNFPNVKHTNANIKNIMLRAKIQSAAAASPLVFLPYTVEEDMRAEDIAYHYYGDAELSWLVYWANNIIDPYNDWIISEENFNNAIHAKYKGSQVFYDYMLAKGSYSGWTIEEVAATATFDEVIEFVQDTTTVLNVVEYRKYNENEGSISVDTYTTLPNYQVGTTVPTATTREDGTAISVGDIFYDDTADQFYVWSATLGGWLESNNGFISKMIHSEWYPMRIYEMEIEKNENKRQIQLIDAKFVSQIIRELKVRMND